MIEDSAAKALSTAPVAAAQAAPAAAPPAEAAPAKKPNMLKNMVLFLLSPFIGLLYAVLLPFVGLGMLAWIAMKKDDKAATPHAE
jgi:hypothetical protein